MGPEPVWCSVPPGAIVVVGVADAPSDGPGAADVPDIGEDGDVLYVGDAPAVSKANVTLSLAVFRSLRAMPAGPGRTVAVPLAPM